jgi:hypothetical protein
VSFLGRAEGQAASRLSLIRKAQARPLQACVGFALDNMVAGLVFLLSISVLTVSITPQISFIQASLI